jgi:hypothetical protein
MDEKDCHRQKIPGASEYVRVRREDLIWAREVIAAINNAANPITAPQLERIMAALEAPCPDQ